MGMYIFKKNIVRTEVGINLRTTFRSGRPHFVLGVKGNKRQIVRAISHRAQSQVVVDLVNAAELLFTI